MSKHSIPEIAIIAFHYTTNEILETFVANHNFAGQMIIIDATNEAKNSNPNIHILQSTTDSAATLLSIAKKQITTPWVLELKTTYFVTEPLLKEIIEIIESKRLVACQIKRNFAFFGENITHGTIEREAITCLYPIAHWSQKLNTIKLKEKIENSSYVDFDGYNTALTLETQEEAKLLFEKKIKPNYYCFLLKPFFFFCRHYFFYGGFLNGKKGYILVYIHSFAVLKKYLQLWLKYNKLN